jgi:hypothetical protein
MALADYRRCDKCGNKAFYDADLRYNMKEYPPHGLYLLGDWVVLCTNCAKTFECVIVERHPDTTTETLDSLPNGKLALDIQPIGAD